MYLKKLLNLSVYTQSGQHLGKVIDLEINTDTGHISTYIIKSSNVIKNLFQESLSIDHSHVISISDEKMVVEDTSIPIKEVVPSGVVN